MNARLMAVVMLMVVRFSAAASPDAAGQAVRMIDGREYAGTVAAVTGEQVILRTSSGEAAVPLAEVQEIVLGTAAKDAMTQAGQKLVLSARGDVLVVSSLEASAELGFEVMTELTRRIIVPMQRVSAVLLPEGRATPGELMQSLPEEVASGSDSLFIRSQGQLTPVAGTLRRIHRDKVTFHFGGQDRTIDTARVAGVRLATPKDERPPRGWLEGKDGTRLAFDTLLLNESHILVEGTCAGTLEVPIERAARIVFQSESVTFLSDLTPEAVEQAGAFDHVFPFARNANTLGREIRLDGRAYGNGIGMHSRCRLTYSLEGRYSTLAMLAGIDDAVRPAGQAELSIIGDGRVLLGPTLLTGKSAGMPVRLDVSGVKKLEILVDFGPMLDIGDHVVLAEARLIR